MSIYIIKIIVQKVPQVTVTVNSGTHQVYLFTTFFRSAEGKTLIISLDLELSDYKITRICILVH